MMLPFKRDLLIITFLLVLCSIDIHLVVLNFVSLNTSVTIQLKTI